MFAADRNLCVLSAEFLPTEGNFVYEGQLLLLVEVVVVAVQEQ